MGSLQWTDAGPQIAPDPQCWTRVRTESLVWVRRVIRSELLPAKPVFKLGSLVVAKWAGETPRVYDSTRMKFQLGDGDLFVTQTAGKLYALFRPVADPAARLLAHDEQRSYLEEHVKRLFTHALAMLSLCHEEQFTNGFALGIDLGRMLKSSSEMTQAVRALDPELPEGLRGPLFSYYWGSAFFCTDGCDVFASFHKVMGGKVISVDCQKW